MAYIYLHRRNDTGEVFYVGKGSGGRATTTRGRNQHWHRVVNKAGFTAEIIVRGLTDEEAYWAEPLLIEAHGGVGNLTNLIAGGEGLTSEEAKALWQDPEYREKMSKARKEMWQDPAFREKRSNALKEAMQDPEFRERRSKIVKEQMLEQWQDPEYREKISEARKEQWQDPEYREKISKAAKEQMLEQWQDPAYREKQSKTRKEQWQDPAIREKMSKARKEMWKDPAYREKISKARKRKVECDKCGRMIGVTRLPQHQRGPRCYNPTIDS